jgi:hypothetical protein
VSEAALAIINAQYKPQAGCDTSSVINRIAEASTPKLDHRVKRR